ncbi:MAG TPA: tetraacyldisaccharide 4'-kinase [Bacteroidales bacterium]|nr:tetraacyldisaccharide 4'-kinase [Bacteroidales bacterium]
MFDNKNSLLYPFSLIYGMVTGIRNFLYDAEVFRSKEFPIPVICIGNITMGGTGKTPHTEYLAGLLSKEFRVAVLSRGYKRKSTDFRIVKPDSAITDSGDEPLQIASKFPNVVVAVERDRVKGVKKISELYPDTDVIILDDGFQHRALKPGFSVLLSDFSRPLPEDHLLPYGSLRESRNNIRRADVILITKTPPDISPIGRRLVVTNAGKLPYQNLYFTAIKYLKPKPVFDNAENRYDLEWNSFSANGAVLVTGIANTSPLEEHIKRFFSTVVHLGFSDHHDFTNDDLSRISGAWNELKTPVRYIITTEKDAMRLRNFTDLPEDIKAAFYYIPIGIEFLNNDKNEFEKLIIDYVRRNKGNNRISA